MFLLQASTTTDAVECARRSYDYSVTAELQWQLLAPPGLSTDHFRLNAFVEPPSRVSIDLYDWSLNGSTVSLTMLDAAHALVARPGGPLDVDHLEVAVSVT